MSDTPLPAGSFAIVGTTLAGRPFRPSDWAERLCGVMSSFRPPSSAAQQHLTFSPYVMPSHREGTKSVVVDARVRHVEPMAYDFLRRFAADNELQVVELGPGSGAPGA